MHNWAVTAFTNILCVSVENSDNTNLHALRPVFQRTDNSALRAWDIVKSVNKSNYLVVNLVNLMHKMVKNL